MKVKRSDLQKSESEKIIMFRKIKRIKISPSKKWKWNYFTLQKVKVKRSSPAPQVLSPSSHAPPHPLSPLPWSRLKWRRWWQWFCLLKWWAVLATGCRLIFPLAAGSRGADGHTDQRTEGGCDDDYKVVLMRMATTRDHRNVQGGDNDDKRGAGGRAYWSADRGGWWWW